MNAPLESLTTLVGAITRARDLDDALSRFAAELDQMEFAPIVVAYVALQDDGPAKILASWNAFESLFSPGLEVDPSITEFAEQLLAGVRAGDVQSYLIDSGRLGLIGDLLLGEGVRSGLAIPIRATDRVIGCVWGGLGLMRLMGSDVITMFDAFSRGSSPALQALIGSFDPSSLED